MFNQHVKELLERSIATIIEVKLNRREYRTVHKALNRMWLTEDNVQSQEESDMISDLMCYKFAQCTCTGLSHRSDCEFHVIPL
jgi:hypothetical protein